MKKKKILVLSGGMSNEREVSLKSGRQVYNNLNHEKYEKCLIDISKTGKFEIVDSDNDDYAKNKKELRASLNNTEKSEIKKYDVVFIAMHGKYGEDGRIQALLDLLDMAYTGSNVLASSLGMNKLMTKKLLEQQGIRTAKHIDLFKHQVRDKNSFENQVSTSLGFPCVVKPNEAGSSIGISIIKEKKELAAAIKKAFNEDSKVIIEEYIDGREITCGVMGNYGTNEIEVLPPVEIISGNEFFDYNAKYESAKTKEICPAKISTEETSRVQNIAKKVHETMECDGVTRSDFVMTKSGEFFFLEINTLPGLTQQSLVPKEAIAAGMTFPEFLDKQIELALENKQY